MIIGNRSAARQILFFSLDPNKVFMYAAARIVFASESQKQAKIKRQ